MHDKLAECHHVQGMWSSPLYAWEQKHTALSNESRFLFYHVIVRICWLSDELLDQCTSGKSQAVEDVHIARPVALLDCIIKAMDYWSAITDVVNISWCEFFQIVIT